MIGKVHQSVEVGEYSILFQLEEPRTEIAYYFNTQTHSGIIC